MEKPRRRLLLAVALGVGAAAVALWGQGGPLPPPLVTQSDLPPIPDAADNGWTEFEALPSEFSVELSEEVSLALFRARDDDGSVADRWEALIDASEALRLPASPGRVQALEAWFKAVQAPVLAYDCRATPQRPCVYFLYVKIHELALAECARLAVDGHWDAAKDQLANTIRADRELLASSRNGIGAMVALSALGEALPLVHLFEHRHRSSNARLDAEFEALTQYGVLDGGGIRNRIATAIYVSNYESLQAIEDRGVTAFTREGDWRPAMLYDAEHTATLVESAYLEFDSDPSKALGCEWIATVRNPIGCDYFDPESVIVEHETALTSIENDLEVARRWSRRIKDLTEQV